jgi:hypothetical protein
MPYITQGSRDYMEPEVKALRSKIESPGELNYAITRLIGHKWKNQPRYVGICIVIGTLFCVALEFYRRAAAPYEDFAQDRNGDIPEYQDER